MKTPAILGFMLAMVQASYAGPTATAIGIYHWGGQYANSMSGGTDRIVQLGGHVARVVLSPHYYTDYNVGAGCYAGYSLSVLAQEPDVQRALANPSLDVLMLTAYDGVTFADCEHPHYLNPSFYTPDNTAAIEQEYSDFTLYLYTSSQHTTKRFIISDWEGDNAIYCQAAYSYATDPQFRSYCDTNYATLYRNQTVGESIEGLRLWEQARQRGIAAGRSRAGAMAIGEMRVYFAPEFCITRVLHDNRFQSVLYDVLPHILFDYVSYSAYESINSTDPAGTLISDLNTIQAVVGSSAIIIGESGFSRSVWGTDVVVRRTDVVINAAVSWGVPFIFQWNVYDQDPQNEFGLYDLDGNSTTLGTYFHRKLSGTFWQSSAPLSGRQ